MRNLSTRFGSAWASEHRLLYEDSLFAQNFAKTGVFFFRKDVSTRRVFSTVPLENDVVAVDRKNNSRSARLCFGRTERTGSICSDMRETIASEVLVTIAVLLVVLARGEVSFLFFSDSFVNTISFIFSRCF